jgi:ubiquinone/menaquinone biosynthesis C-methylase UbiE
MTLVGDYGTVSEHLSDHVQKNRDAWDQFAADYVETGERNWAATDVTWGIFDVPESQLRMLPEDASCMDVVELGCGTGYVSAWLARRGARPVALDNSPAQLETARRLQEQHGLAFPLHLGNAEATPFADEQFDFAISEYGASIWCDPYLWIPEAARILKPGGRLVFLINSVLLMLCSGADEEAPVLDKLERPLFGMHRFEWQDNSVEFHLPHGELIRLLRSSGFEIEELIEVQVPPDATTRYPYVDGAWASKWPSEEVWKVRKRD